MTVKKDKATTSSGGPKLFVKLKMGLENYKHMNCT